MNLKREIKSVHGQARSHVNVTISTFDSDEFNLYNLCQESWFNSAEQTAQFRPTNVQTVNRELDDCEKTWQTGAPEGKSHHHLAKYEHKTCNEVFLTKVPPSRSSYRVTKIEFKPLEDETLLNGLD